MDALDEVFCDVTLTKRLPDCEHCAQLACSADPRQHSCASPCGGLMACCGRDCRFLCSQCQGVNSRDDGHASPIQRIQHLSHPCEKSLYCGHSCGKKCAQDHVCNVLCEQECRQQCAHARCKSYCSTPCAPCMERCTWACSHHVCPVPCGSVRLIFTVHFLDDDG
jgi:hypothetical protein